MLIAIQQMNFYLRTGYGDSTKFYGGNKECPYQGVCQGNGAAPAIWLLISSLIILLMKDKNMNMNITSAFSTITLSYVTLMFVDDGDFPTLARYPSESIKSVVKRHQDTVDVWSKGLRVSGGSLKPEKCFWYPIEWKWNNGIAKILPLNSGENKIMAPDPQERILPITCLDTSESREIMGIWQTPTGGMEKQIEMLKHKVQEWMNMLKNDYLPRHVIWRAFWGTIWMSIRYTLPAITISKNQGAGILIPLYKQFLPKIGVSSTLPLPYRYGSIEHYGLGLPQLQNESLISKLNFYLMHNGINTISGHHLQISAEYVQLEIGLSKQFFSLSYKKYGYLASNCWLTSLWSDISMFPSLKLKYKMPGFPIPPRINDGFLMDFIFLLQRYSNEQMISINRQRLYLHVIFLSDITTGNGSYIRNDVFSNETKPRLSSYSWPRVEPTKRDFILWSEALQLISTQSGKLSQSLGAWTSSTHLQYQDYYNPISQEYFINSIHYEGKCNKWKRFITTSERRTRNYPLFKFTKEVTNIPSHLCIGTSYSVNRDHIVMESYANPPKYSIPTKTLKGIVEGWGETWIWQEVDISEEGQWLANAIQGDRALLVCDGSYQPMLSKEIGAAAWIIECSLTKKQARGLVRSTTSTASAYRSELMGLYSSLLLVSAVCTLYKIKDGSINVGCDNEKALELTSETNQRIPCHMKHSDILKSIRIVRSNIPIKMHFQHILGHQDENILYENLTRDAQLNVDCDFLAKQWLQQFYTKQLPPPHLLPHEITSIWLNNKKIVGDVGIPIRSELSRIEMRYFLNSRNILKAVNFDLVDWKSIKEMLINKPQQYQLWLTKHVSGFCGTNNVMHKRKKELTQYAHVANYLVSRKIPDIS